MILNNAKLAKFAGKPLGTILSDDEGVALMRAYRQHGKANFRALRERVGMSQQDVADALGVSCRTVKRWEHEADRREPPADAVGLLTKQLDVQRQMVGTCERVTEEAGRMPSLVPITYYRDQSMYDEFGRDSGPFGVANANARAVAQELEALGCAVEFRYPCEDVDSSISAARSATESD
jgi:transcriptional regulator with XRE-family HTH domain